MCARYSKVALSLVPPSRGGRVSTVYLFASALERGDMGYLDTSPRPYRCLEWGSGALAVQRPVETHRVGEKTRQRP